MTWLEELAAKKEEARRAQEELFARWDAAPNRDAQIVPDWKGVMAEVGPMRGLTAEEQRLAEIEPIDLDTLDE